MSASMISLNVKKGPDYFKMHKMVLKMCGLSFTGNENRAYKIYSFIILTTTIFAYPILDTIELFKHDFETSSAILIYQTSSLIAVAKALSILISGVKIGKVLAKLEQVPFLPNPNRGGKEEERLINECVWKTNLQTYIYWGLSVGNVTINSLYSLSTRITNSDYRKWQLSYGPLTILDITSSPSYEITWFYQSLCLFTICGVFTTIDLIIATVLAHISCQFKILQHFLRNIVWYSHKKMSKTGPGQIYISKSTNNAAIRKQYLQRSIKEAVKYHAAIFELAKEMEESFKYMLLATFVVSMALLCSEIYQAAYQNTGSGITRHLFEYVSSSLQIFTVCYWGEEVLAHSKQVGEAAFESDFAGSDVNFQKALVMIIRRSQIPTKLTAGKLANICLSTCLSIWRASYTLFMVLRDTK